MATKTIIKFLKKHPNSWKFITQCVQKENQRSARFNNLFLSILGYLWLKFIFTSDYAALIDAIIFSLYVPYNYSIGLVRTINEEITIYELL